MASKKIDCSDTTLHLHNQDQNEFLQRRDFHHQKRMHLINVFMDVEQSNEQLESDLNLAMKESQRDMYDASNQKLQTLILSSTVMFVSLSTVIIQGQADTKDTSAPVYCMAAFGSLSFSLLFASIVSCIELLNRTAKFMMKQSDSHQFRIDLAQKRNKKVYSTKPFINLNLLIN